METFRKTFKVLTFLRFHKLLLTINAETIRKVFLNECYAGVLRPIGAKQIEPPPIEKRHRRRGQLVLYRKPHKV